MQHDMTAAWRQGPWPSASFMIPSSAQRLAATTFLIPLTSKPREGDLFTGRGMPPAHGLGRRDQIVKVQSLLDNRAASVGRTCHSLQRCYPHRRPTVTL